MKKIITACMFALMTITACSSGYTPAPQILPEHIKKVYVKPFTNNTNQFGLEAKLTNAVVDELLKDGRLSIVNTEAEADGILIGEIKRYVLQPLTYDANMVATQYKLWVVVNVYFVDNKDYVTLWAEPNMEGIQIYADISKDPYGRTEEEARAMVWEVLSRNIVKRTIKGFGSVSGISEKKLPESN